MSSTASSLPSRDCLSPRNIPMTMTFPPPPTTETRPANKNKKKNVPIALSFKPQSRHSSDSSSSSIESFSIEKAPRPILKKPIRSTKRTRQFILLFLLILSFIILILSVILAYCAALPHSDNIAGAQASTLAASIDGFAGPVTSTIGLSSSTSTPATATATSAPDPILPASGYKRRLTSRDTPTYDTPKPENSSETTAITAALAQDAKDHATFSAPSAMAALVFYTAALPVLTMLHTSIELLISLVRPETSQGTKLGDKLLFRGAGGSSVSSTVLSRRRIGTLISFTVSLMLIPAWLVIQMVTMNCEIVTFGANGESVCPVQIRGHRMGGVSQLSVGKVVLGWAVLMGYIGYVGFLWRVVGVFGGRRGGHFGGKVEGAKSGFRRRARFAMGEREREGLDEDGEGSFTVVKVDEGRKENAA